MRDCGQLAMFEFVRSRPLKSADSGCRLARDRRAVRSTN